MASAGGDWKDMYYAAERGDIACVAYHLSQGVDVDYQHPEAMMSALVAATLQGQTAVVQLLLEHGADPNMPAQMGGLTALQAAQQIQHPALEQLLQTFGATPSVKPHRSFWERWLAL
ncbi:MAG: ankyrin repeat domain-containing protein [Comamonas sp.]